MTATIMTRPAAGRAPTAEDPEYWCSSCRGFHSGPCASAADRQLGDLLARMVREADARVPAGRRARRTLQDMMPGYERQPLLVLHRPVMADDACPLCGRWNCNPSTCPPASAAPAPAAAGNGLQCAVCGGRFGAVPAPTAWTCDACRNARR